MRLLAAFAVGTGLINMSLYFLVQHIGEKGEMFTVWENFVVQAHTGAPMFDGRALQVAIRIWLKDSQENASIGC
jgi:hypothetical protein